MAEVIGGVERVEGPIAQLAVLQVEVLLGVVMDGEDIDPGAGSGPDDEVDDAPLLLQHVQVVEADGVVDEAVELGADHAPLGHGEPGGVGHHRLLEGDLGSVGEAGDHLGGLAPLGGEASLGGRCAVVVE